MPTEGYFDLSNCKFEVEFLKPDVVIDLVAFVQARLTCQGDQTDLKYH